jgi:hypothetical protein
MASQVHHVPKDSLSEILAPVIDHLKKLKALTPESLPAYNANLSIKPHSHILKQKLLPIGQFIVDYLEQTPLASRGVMEVMLCTHIADNYWPLPTNLFTHLKIQETYRNALFKIAHRTSDEPPAKDTTPNNASPKDELPEDTRLSGGSPAILETNSEQLPGQPQASAIEPDPAHSSLDAVFVADILDLNTRILSPDALREAKARDLNNG